MNKELKNLNSNDLNSDICSVCFECGDYTAKISNKKVSNGVHTSHIGICDFCGEKKTLTNVRAFGYPDFTNVNLDEIKSLEK